MLGVDSMSDITDILSVHRSVWKNTTNRNTTNDTKDVPNAENNLKKNILPYIKHNERGNSIISMKVRQSCINVVQGL